MNKMDVLGNKGICRFKEHYKKIWENYQRYGDIVRIVEFDESEMEIDEIFVDVKNEIELEEKLIDLWKKKYQIVINSNGDIAKVYQIINKQGENNGKDIEPKKIYKCKKGCIGYCQFYIEEEFLNEIIQSGRTNIFHNNCIYEITIDPIFEIYIIIKKEIIKKSA